MEMGAVGGRHVRPYHCAFFTVSLEVPKQGAAAPSARSSKAYIDGPSAPGLPLPSMAALSGSYGAGQINARCPVRSWARRPRTYRKVRDLIQQLSRANPFWSTARIHDELLIRSVSLSITNSIEVESPCS